MSETLIKILENISESLDEIQETPVFQDNDELIYEIGEAIGYIDNCITILEEKEAD